MAIYATMQSESRGEFQDHCGSFATIKIDGRLNIESMLDVVQNWAGKSLESKRADRVRIYATDNLQNAGNTLAILKMGKVTK